MATIELDDIAKLHISDFEDFSSGMKDDVRGAMREAIRQALEIAAEKAEVRQGVEMGLNTRFGICTTPEVYYSVNKQSISDIIKLVK